LAIFAQQKVLLATHEKKKRKINIDKTYIALYAMHTVAINKNKI